MSRPRRLLLLLLPAALQVLLAVFPGHAQQTASSRFAFADTTLLRDTLNLHFDRLFPLADSLGLTPDTLRALSVRYRHTLDRMVWLADSLKMPVDSVGVYLDRERYNPLAATTRRETDFKYGSTYQVQQASQTWTNNTDFNAVRGPLFLRNATNVELGRFNAGSRTTQRQNRVSNTELGWRLSQGLSVGARANLNRFNTIDPASTSNDNEIKNEYQVSVRTRQQPRKSLRSELNVFGGFLDLSGAQQVKRGVSGDVNGKISLQTPYLTHDLTGQVTGNIARTRLPDTTASMGTNDLSNNLRGTLGVLPGMPVGLNLNYAIRRIRVETPTDTTVMRVRTQTSNVDATLRLRQDNDRYLNVTGRYGDQLLTQATVLNSRSTRRDLAFGLDGRYLLRGWNLDGRFSLNRTRSEYPARGYALDSTLAGYGESLRVATIDVTISRNLTQKIVFKATGSVSLNSYRYYLFGRYSNPPWDKDLYRQSYRIEGQYKYSQRFDTGLALDVSRNVLVNIPAANVGANNELRSYRAEWQWNFQMMPGLTATQKNALTADYTHYPFLTGSDQLSLDYSVITRLSAVFSQRFTLDISHNSRTQPQGKYSQFPDGNYYLSRSSRSEDYTLSARASYMPSPVFSLTISPQYQATDRQGSVGGGLVPQTSTRGLNFAGGANLNLPIGGKGRLTGDVTRTFRTDRTINYTGSSASATKPTDFWGGNLELTWQL